MIFTVAQLIRASHLFIDEECDKENLDKIKVLQHVNSYGKLTHLKIRNQKNEGGEQQEALFLSNEREFINLCISQYNIFEGVDREIQIAYICLIKGAAYIIRLNEKILFESNEIAEEFLRKLEVK